MKENTDVDVAGATIQSTGEQSIVCEFFFCLRFFPAFLVWTDLDWMSERRISQNFVIFASFLVNWPYHPHPVIIIQRKNQSAELDMAFLNGSLVFNWF